MRSDVVKKGVIRAPHRSLLKALGITDEEMVKPFIGVEANCSGSKGWNKDGRRSSFRIFYYRNM